MKKIFILYILLSLGLGVQAYSSNFPEHHELYSLYKKKKTSYKEEVEKVLDFVRNHENNQLEICKHVDPTNDQLGVSLIARSIQHPAGDLISILSNNLISLITEHGLDMFNSILKNQREITKNTFPLFNGSDTLEIQRYKEVEPLYTPHTNDYVLCTTIDHPAGYLISMRRTVAEEQYDPTHLPPPSSKDLGKWTSQDEELLQALIFRGYTQDCLIEKKKSFYRTEIGGSSLKKLLSLTLTPPYSKERSYLIIKVFECDFNGFAFKMAHQTFEDSVIEQFTEKISQYSTQYSCILPTLVAYQGLEIIGQQPVAVMPKARGDNLKKFSESIIGNMEDEEIFEMFSSIGSQMGNLTSVFFREQKGCLKHPDSNLENLFYDKKRKIFSWIDLDGINLILYSPDYPREYWDAIGMNITFMNVIFDLTASLEHEGNLLNKYEREGTDSLRGMKKGLIAYKAFFTFYLDRIKNLQRNSLNYVNEENIYSSKMGNTTKFLNMILGEKLAPTALTYLGLVENPS